MGRRLPANDLLRQARLRLASPAGSGRPMSRQELAEQVNDHLYQRTGRVHALDASYVGKLERGQHRWPNDLYREAFRTVLGATCDTDLGFHIIRGLTQPALSAPHGHQPPAFTGRPGQRHPPADDHGDPTSLLTTVLAGTWDTGPTPAGSTATFTDHTAVATRLASLYRSAQPHLVLPMAAAYADSLVELLDREAVPARHTDDFTRLVVGVQAQVGLWACHADRPAMAHSYLALAVEIAASADSSPLRACALGALSYLYSSAPRGGRGGNPTRALALLDEALDRADEADPFTRGWLATWRADQHAALGNLEQAQRDVDHAEANLDRVADDQPLGFFSRPSYGYGMRGHLDSVRAVVQALTGHTGEADRLFGQVHASAANMRRRIATYGHQALTHTARAEPEAACALLARSVELAAGERYGMGLRRALGVRTGFDPAWSASPCVRDLDERLAVVAASTT